MKDFVEHNGFIKNFFVKRCMFKVKKHFNTFFPILLLVWLLNWPKTCLLLQLSYGVRPNKIHQKETNTGWTHKCNILKNEVEDMSFEKRISRP